MQLSITSIISSLISGGCKKNEAEIKALIAQDHTYIKGDIENRGPCPGLNSLANQGWIARDGKNLTLTAINNALMTALHMDKYAAGSLTLSLKPLLRSDGTFDLVDTRRHNIIEHDSSFTRLDFRQGDNFTFQPYMLEAMINDATSHGEKEVTLRSLARTFRRRDQESKAEGMAGLGIKLWVVRVLQCVGVMNTAQTGGVLSREVLEAVFVEERFPEVVLANQTPRTLGTLLGNALGMMRFVCFGS